MRLGLETTDFLTRVKHLPNLGLGVSTEYGAGLRGLDPFELARRYPHFGAFLEVGVEVEKGLDEHALHWAASARASTYHFLDVNLHEYEELDAVWLRRVNALIEQLKPAWLCGDAGLWHVGPRDRNHMLLLPPVLTLESADAMAQGIRGLRAATGLEVLPENPPGEVFIGDLHLIHFFRELCERADTGLLLDIAHLEMFQRAWGLPSDAELDALPFERIVEIHIAGGTERQHEGYPWIEDSHSAEPLPEVWELFERIVPKCSNLKAVVFECERNTIEDVQDSFQRVYDTLQGSPLMPVLKGGDHV